MDVVEFSGKEYTKASVVAKRFNYTSDYIGQLCRAKKVDARLVGRAWYVNLDSLLEHRKGKYKKPTEIELEPTEKVIKNYLSRIDVEPILNKKIVKILKNKGDLESEVRVRYESDENVLFPRVDKSDVSTVLHADTAGEESLTTSKEVSGTKTFFKAEPLPDSLSILDYDVVPTEVEKKPKNIAKSEETPSKKKVLKPEVVLPNFSKSISNTVKVRLDKSNIKQEEVAIALQPAKKIAPKPVSHATSTVRSVSQASKPTLKTEFRPKSIQPVSRHTQPRRRGILVPVTAFVLAVLCSGLAWSTHQEILVTQSTSSSKLILQTANLATLFTR